MVEGLDVPLDERKIFSIVLRVAACTLLAGARRNVVGGVETFVRRESRRDFGMTVQALQRGLAAELVATRAIGGSI